MSFLILGTVFLFIGRSVLMTDRQQSMTETADEIARTAAAYSAYSAEEGAEGYGGLRSMELRILLSSAANTSGYHIFICDETGAVVSCSERPDQCGHVGQALSRTALACADTKTERGVLTNMDGFYDQMRFVVGAGILLNDDLLPDGYVFVSGETKAYAGVWTSFSQVFFFASAVVLFIAVIMSFVASKRMAKPLNDMAVASSRFAHGDFSSRVEISDRDDEIGALTEAFNAMADSLAKSEELRREFIANVSHELKTPMTTIAGFADGILDGTIPKESQDKYLQTISSETKRLSRLVRRMLELSRIQGADKEELLRREFDVCEMLKRTLLTFEDKMTKRGLDADAQIPEESVLVRGDEDAIQQVVYNLLENATKFADPGSTVTLSLWKQEGKAYVSVKNQGETIDAQELNLIFDRFHKTDRSRSRDRDGVGLGLYIVKSILGNHDEDIYVTSKDGVTEFVFTLALKGKAKPPAAKNPV